MPIVVLSQNKVIDSLENELRVHVQRDTTRVNILNALAFKHFVKDIPKTREYLQEAHTIAQTNHFKKGEARSIYIKGITYAIQSEYEQALLYYNEALKLYESISFKKGIADSYNAMGITYKNKGELRTATVYLEKAIILNEEIGSNNLSASLLNLGTTYSDLGDFDEAILYLKKALIIAEDNKHEQRIAYSLNNLGTIYNIQGNYPLALDHFNKSMSIHEKLDDSISIAHGFSNMASIFKVQKYSEKAIKYYEKSLDIYERINNKHKVSSTLNGIGTIYEDLKDYQSALDYYLEALRIGKEVGENSETPYILNNIGGIYFAYENYDKSSLYHEEGKKISLEKGNKETACKSFIGLAKIDMHKKDYDNALDNALKAEKISKDSGFLELQKEVLEILSKIYKAKGNFQDAFDSYEQYKLLNDSIFNKENIEKITQLEYEYKYKQQIDSLSINELKLTKKVLTTSQDLEKSQHNLFLGVIAFLITALVLCSIIFFLKLRNEKAKTQNIAIEQKLLRSQMTPHFIFNSLSVLQGMILNKEDKKSVFYLSKFSKLLRITLENSRDKLVLLHQELIAVKDYLELQNLEESQSYDYTILVDKSIDETLFMIPPMLIQPFIENAIEHAFESQKENRKIDIQITYINKELICTITDNGIGIDAQNGHKRKNKKSLATTITSERLKMLSKDFNINGSVQIEDRKKYKKQGTIVTLVIPYKTVIA